MGLTFEWDEQKEARNEAKHGVSFAEAATAFADTLSLTIADPDHSEQEDRFLLLGMTQLGRIVVVGHTERGTIYVYSLPVWRHERRCGSMNDESNPKDDAELREEYEFSGGERGKYARRFKEGSNVVVLDPDVALIFKDSKSVNQALRKLAGSVKNT